MFFLRFSIISIISFLSLLFSWFVKKSFNFQILCIKLIHCIVKTLEIKVPNFSFCFINKIFEFNSQICSRFFFILCTDCWASKNCANSKCKIMISLVMSEEGFNAPKFYSGSSIVAGASDFISHYLVLCTYSKSINFINIEYNTNIWQQACCCTLCINSSEECAHAVTINIIACI